MAKTIISIIFIMFSSSPWAAWTGKKEIALLKAQTNGIYIVLKDFVNNDPDIQCGSNGFFMSTASDVNYESRVSFLLASYLSGKPVNISYYGCASGHIGLGSVSFE